MQPTWVESSRLWLVLDRRAAAPLSLHEVTRQAISGGVDVVLCRIKDAAREEVRRESSAVRALCREERIPFVMSHFPDLALELEAEGVQLGVEDAPLNEVRAQVGEGMVIGYSTHSVEEARRRFDEGADYVFLGPVFATPEKLKYGYPLGVAVVNAASGLPGPVVFIGGISLANVGQITGLGGRRIAAISSLQRVGDPAEAARRLREML